MKDQTLTRNTQILKEFLENKQLKFKSQRIRQESTLKMAEDKITELDDRREAINQKQGDGKCKNVTEIVK